jgi:RNA polymerase sigma-70 factor, ECF subfamily
MLLSKKYRDQEDEELMKLVSAGDKAAFEEIYDRYSRRITGYFYKMLWSDREKAEDFMHDLFVKIIDRPELFDPSRRFQTWLFSVAHNMCKNEYRKQSVRHEVNHTPLEDHMASTKSDSTMKKIDGQSFRKHLYRELDEMDENHRTTFVLRYEMDFSIKEISNTMACSEGTVKSRLFYTVKKLNTKLKYFDPKSTTPISNETPS